MAENMVDKFQTLHEIVKAEATGGSHLCQGRRRGPLQKAHLRRYGALGRTLNVQRVRLACGLRAPPRSWTFLSSLLRESAVVGYRIAGMG